MKLFGIAVWKLGAFVLGGTFLALQFVPVERTNPPVEGDLDAPAEIHAILKRSCYDCHSHETNWPWYSRVAPISWLVTDDVKVGRKKLNFSKWGELTQKKQARQLRECQDEIEEGSMPLPAYVWTHPRAALSTADRKTLGQWFDRILSREDE